MHNGNKADFMVTEWGTGVMYNDDHDTALQPGHSTSAKYECQYHRNQRMSSPEVIFRVCILCICIKGIDETIIVY